MNLFGPNPYSTRFFHLCSIVSTFDWLILFHQQEVPCTHLGCFFDLNLGQLFFHTCMHAYICTTHSCMLPSMHTYACMHGYIRMHVLSYIHTQSLYPRQTCKLQISLHGISFMLAMLDRHLKDM